MPKKWTSLVPPPSPDARVTMTIGELNSLVERGFISGYVVETRKKVYKCYKKGYVDEGTGSEGECDRHPEEEGA